MVHHRLLLGSQPRDDKGRCNNRQQDGDSAIGPTPIRLVEALGERGPCKRGDDIRRRGEGEREASVLQRRGIRSQNIHGEYQTGGANRIEHLRGMHLRQSLHLGNDLWVTQSTDLCCTICAKTLASRHQDKTQQRQRKHQGEPNQPVPEVEDLGDWHRAGCGHDARNRADDRKE